MVINMLAINKNSLLQRENYQLFVFIYVNSWKVSLLFALFFIP